MELKFVDPRALKEKPDKARRSKSSPQADALATIRTVGIVQPPVVAPEHGYPNAILSEITADAVAADAVEGRTAA